eukprot:m.16854 g.16854  ORF g.16854 m.16854 type:complete len:67 (-) comp6991_c0_seq1:86-286(-)
MLGKTLLLLLWKNATLQKRRFWVSFSQVFFPLLFFALLALLRLSIPREDGGQREPAWIVKCVHTFT